MYGICGYINLDKKPINDLDGLKEMAGVMAHRGSNDEKFL